MLGSAYELPCGQRVKNRLVKAAMTEGLADEFNRATDRHAELYRRWANGGAGALLTGNVQVDRRYLERAGNIVIDGPQDKDQLASLAAMAEAGTADHGHALGLGVLAGGEEGLLQQLELGPAARNYAEYARSDDAWMLGRFILPAARLPDPGSTNGDTAADRAASRAGSVQWSTIERRRTVRSASC